MACAPPVMHAPCHACPLPAMHAPLPCMPPTPATHTLLCMPPYLACPPAMHAPSLPCMPPPCHACPLPAMHAPSLPCMPSCHACPPAMHAPHPCHTPPAMHAPLPRMPPPCMPPPPHMPPCHICPLPRMPPGHACPPTCPPPTSTMHALCPSTHASPLWTEWLTDRCKNITFRKLRLRAVIKIIWLCCRTTGGTQNPLSWQKRTGVCLDAAPRTTRDPCCARCTLSRPTGNWRRTSPSTSRYWGLRKFGPGSD